MKVFPTLSCLSIAFALTATAQVKETTTEKSVTRNPDGSVRETTTTTAHFNPEAQANVVEYFNTYKANPHGLPPEWSKQMNIKQIPRAWSTTRLAPGTVLTEEHRGDLMAAPPAWVQVLPPAPAEVGYYVAGANIVAVDKSSKVVDSIRVPSLRFYVEVDGDGGEIKLSAKKRTTSNVSS